MEERINAAIHGVGVAGSELTPIRRRYDGYLGWMEQPQVLCLRFEDLILNRQTALGSLLDYIESCGFRPDLPAPAGAGCSETAIAPRKSGTFRKGQPGTGASISPLPTSPLSKTPPAICWCVWATNGQ